MKSVFQDVADLLAQVANDHKVPGLAAAGIVDGELAHAAVMVGVIKSGKSQ
jgi:hypothetical protein